MRLMLVCLLCCSAALLGAATIDVDYAKMRDGKIGVALSSALATTPAEGEVAKDPLVDCKRVLIFWNGPNLPPVLRFLGIDGIAYCKHLEDVNAVPVDTQFGPAFPLPNQKGFAVVAIGANELLMGPPAMLSTMQEVPPWPETNANVLSFSGPATDLKLGDLQEELKEFVFTWEPSGAIILKATANNKNDAKAVLHYISVRAPLLDAAAALGIDKAEFPAKLLDAATFDRQNNVIIARLSLDDATRTQAVAYLANQVRKQMKKYR